MKPASCALVLPWGPDTEGESPAGRRYTTEKLPRDVKRRKEEEGGWKEKGDDSREGMETYPMA